MNRTALTHIDKSPSFCRPLWRLRWRVAWSLRAARTRDAGGGAGALQSAGWHVRGIISNFDAVTTMPGPILFDPIHELGLTWSVAADPLSTGGDGALLVRVQGAPSTTIRWVASVRTTEVMFPAP